MRLHSYKVEIICECEFFDCQLRHPLLPMIQVPLQIIEPPSNRRF